MSPRSRVERTSSLRELLRRMASMPPDVLSDTLSDCAKGASDEVKHCIRDYGPLAAMVRLAPLFPEGYLDASHSARASRHAQHSGSTHIPLIEQLDRRLPQRHRPHRTSISDARLDDIVCRTVMECEASLRKDERGALLSHLFRVYEVAPRLPRLSELVASLKDEVDLSDAVVVAHQHLLGTVASQFEALWELGLEPSRTYIIGKPYSTNRLVAAYLEGRGCGVRLGFERFDREAILAPGWYQNEHDKALGYIFASVVKELPKNNVERLIVLDDGGLILAWLNRAFDSGLFSRSEVRELSQLEVVGVEQTTFGRHLIERLAPARVAGSTFNATVPIANVAQTRLKLEKESELIAKSVVHELEEWIRSSDPRNTHVRELRDASIGVIGFGAVGSWICRTLHHALGQQILVFDDDISHSSIARSSGYRVAQSAHELARKSSIIIGCSGAADGVALEAGALKPGTVLASASSGNYEFARAFMSAPGRSRKRLNPELTPDRQATSFDWLHSIVPIPVPGGMAFVLNSGFPINFTGAVDPIRAEDIELTRCLMVMGIAAGLRELNGEPNFGGTVALARIDEAPVSEMFGV